MTSCSEKIKQSSRELSNPSISLKNEYLSSESASMLKSDKVYENSNLLSLVMTDDELIRQLFPDAI